MNKTYSFLIIETEFSKKINKIIIEEFLIEKSRKIAVIYSRKSKIIQCFDCYEYDHIEKMCKNFTKCDHCAKSHETNRCSKDEIEITHRCINCEQTEHQIWARMCSVRHKEMKRIKKAYDICSVLYFAVIENKTTSMKTKQSNVIKKRLRFEEVSNRNTNVSTTTRTTTAKKDIDRKKKFSIMKQRTKKQWRKMLNY